MLVGACALLGTSLSTAHAQRGNSNSGGNNNVGNTGNIPALVKAVDKYLLGPQDVIGVTIERFPDYGAERVVVPPDGKISLPYFGEPLFVIGKTTQQVQRELTGRINNRIRNPRISVSIKEIRNAALGNVFVVGSVQNQGHHRHLQRLSFDRSVGQSRWRDQAFGRSAGEFIARRQVDSG